MSGSSPKAVITGVSAITAVGLTALQTAASLRAGITRFTELEGVNDEMGEPVVAAVIPSGDPQRPDRLSILLRQAVAAALDNAGLQTRQAQRKVGLLLALPEAARPDCRKGKLLPRVEELQSILADRTGLAHMETVPAGHAAFLIAMSKAMTLLGDETCDTVLIGAADSLVDIPALEWLESQQRLKTGYAPKGFVPGEAAAAIVVERGPAAKSGRAQVWACCHEVVTATEPVGMDSEEPALAKGLTEVLQGALNKTGIGQRDVEVVLCDLNGEPYRGNEWCLARNRALGRAGELAVWHPADALGDVGAASGAVLCVLACAGFARSYWSSPRVLLWTASDTGKRAAVFLTSPNSGAVARTGF